MANPSYDFLNSYLSRVTDDSDKADPNTDMEDDNDFYDTQSNEPQAEEDIEYGLSGPDDDQPDNMDEMTQPGADTDPLDEMLGDDDPYGDSQGEPDSGDTEGDGVDSGVAPMSPITVTGKRNSSKLKNDISGIESGGKYSAFNPKGGGGGAVGKYQFRWNIWQDSIKAITKVKSKDEFLKSPEAQEKYFSWYAKHYLRPEAEKLEPLNKAGLSMDQIQKLVHFRGKTGAKKYLEGKLPDQPEAYNIPISKYIAKKQTGGSAFYMNPTTHFQVGGVAMTPEQQYTGLNDGHYDQLMFPMEGVNEFRGLDSGEPVYLEDETGKKKVLKGRHHRTKMTGKVYEKRLK